MNILILGDKFEKGMKSKGCQALIKYKTSRIIDHQIDFFTNNFKYNNIIYISGFDHKSLKSYLVKKRYHNFHLIHNTNYADTNYGDSLSLAKDFLNDNCIIILGNTLIHKINIRNIQYHISSVFLAKTVNDKKNALGCILDGNNITNIDFDLYYPIHDDIFYITKSDAEKIRFIVDNSEVKNNFIFEIINKLIDDGSQFTSIK